MWKNICVQTYYYSEIIALLILYLVSSAKNAVGEGSASSMRRIKSWLRSTMSQERLNHCMVLSVHKEKTDEINLKNVANVFRGAKEDRRHTFGFFYDRNLLQLIAWGVDIFKKQLANVKGFFFLNPKKTKQSSFLLPESFRNQKNILHVVCSAKCLL